MTLPLAMILNKTPSPIHNYSGSYSASSSTIAYKGDVDEGNKKDNSSEMFEITMPRAVSEGTLENGASDLRELEIEDLTEENCLDTPASLMDRPESLPYYIQATQHNHRAFLTTNLCHDNSAFITALSSTWLIGRSNNCAIVVHHRSVSRCHTVLGYDVQQGFYLMDVGSSNGTYLNGKRLSVLKRYTLTDGDVITLCKLDFEFFVAA